MTGVAQSQSILETLKQPLKVDEELNIYREWQAVLTKMDICPEVRNLGDEWFSKCHKFCEERRKKSESGILHDNTTEEEELFEELLQQLYQQMNNEADPLKKLNLKDQLSKLQSCTPAEWIVKAHQCVVEEQKLIEKYSKIYGDRTKVDTQKPFEILYHKLEEKKMALGKLLEKLETESQNCQQTQQQYQEILQQFQVLQQLLGGVDNSRNGTEIAIQQKNAQMQDAKVKVEQQNTELQKTIMSIKQNLADIYEEAKKLVENLVEEVKQWQHEFKLRYAELAGNVDLDRFAPFCAKTGDLLREVLRADLTRFENTINIVSGDGKSEADPFRTKLDDLLALFYQRTFVVTKQDGGAKKDSWNIRIKDKNLARTPQFTVRILGADTLESLGGAEVHACFLLESRINKHYDCDRGSLDFNAMERDGWNIKTGKSTKFVETRNKRSGQHKTHEATFSIELNVNLDRTKNMQVYEEKYRLIFWARMDGKTYWFAIPTEPLPSMPWFKVAEMLQAKIKSLPSKRRLTEDNINHLKERLLGSAGVADDKVSLDKFCAVEKKEGFTFWMWFLSIYNLIKTYLLDFWETGWIEGFLSKDMTVIKLTESETFKTGMFLLRFSNQHIDKSQGKDTVFGKLATSALIKNNGQCQEVSHVDVFGHDRLADEHLADILLQTKDKKKNKLYRYLYPNADTPCEILFKISQRKAQLKAQEPVNKDGYVGVKVKKEYEADLVRDLREMELERKRRVSTVQNSQDCKNSLEETQENADEMTNYEVKRGKSTLNDMVSENAETATTLPECQRPNAYSLPMLRKLLTEQPHATVNNGKQAENGHTENIGDCPTCQNNNNTLQVHSSCTMEQTPPCQSQTIPCQLILNNSQLGRCNSEAVQDSTMSNMKQHSDMSRIEGANTQNPGGSHIITPDLGEIPNEGQPSRVSIMGNQYGCVSSLDPTRLMEHRDHQKFEANMRADQFKATQTASSFFEENQRVAYPYMCPSSKENNLGDCFLDSILDENLSGGSQSVFPDFGMVNTQVTNSQNMDSTAMQCQALSDEKMIHSQIPSSQNMVPTATQQQYVSEEKIMDSIHENLKKLPPEKAVDTLKPFLESLPLCLLMKIMPFKKNMIEVIAPVLKTLTPELNEMVVKALQDSIEESQSLQSSNQIGSAGDDVAATGLEQRELTPAEIDAGLALSESDIVLDMEYEDHFESLSD